MPVDIGKSFGDDKFQQDLIKIMFEKQNWSKMGDYTYTTEHVGNDLVLKVILGSEHEYDIYNNPLIVRKNVVKTKGCTWPIRRFYKRDTHPPLLQPSIVLQSNYADNIVPACSPVQLRAVHQNYPKNYPKAFTW